MKTVQQVASEIAQELREHPERWTRDADARDEDGRTCGVYDSGAVCWCLLGYLSKIAAPFNHGIWESFAERAAIPLQYIVSWNDSSTRTVADVIALCDKVAS